MTIAALLFGSACAWYLVYRLLRGAVRRTRYNSACDAVNQVSSELARAGMGNAWVVGQDKEGIIKVLPMPVRDPGKVN